MTPPRIQKSTHEARLITRTCKTCTPCRQKKVKCDGTRPQCLGCQTSGLRCAYPQDTRREPRPSKARVQNLETIVRAMLEHMKTSGIVPSHAQLGDWLPEASGHADNDDSTAFEIADDEIFHPPEDGTCKNHSSTGAFAGLPPNPSTSISSTIKDDCARSSMLPAGVTPMSQGAVKTTMYDFHESHGSSDWRPQKQALDIDQTVTIDAQDALDSETTSTSHAAVIYQNNDHLPTPNSSRSVSHPDNQEEPGMSPCEARVAGALHEHGCVKSVHGLASIMNPSSRAQHKANISKMKWQGGAAVSASKARLISNAALQRQRESRIFQQPTSTLDLDGCDPELAKHLFDIHFNRQHYAYLISYRPAIMDSIANGGGPWANKLLLNAIYFSGTLYSDRSSLRADADPNGAGARFYKRFRQLLVDEIDTPSISSAVALLLTSATLVSKGMSSAGWNLSGTAYRMIIDMGCHLSLGPDYQSTCASDHGQPLLLRDLEQEMRKRLYWGAYVTDATQSLYLGRPCMFASTEARVPLMFLDTFEELEDWAPYIDPQSPADRPPAYVPHPAHAVSTFICLAHLFRISTRITELYGIQAMRCASGELQDKRTSIEKALNDWSEALPEHLRFEQQESIVPPPHQITPHTTRHALTILLHRAFLEEGHLRRHCDEAGRRHSEEACISSAMAIERLIRAYRETFTLRRAPFLLSYAIYSAVIVILRQERHDRGRFMEVISFFWTCLSELQHGCNFGLAKPLSILRDMVHEFQVSVQEGGHGLDESTVLDETFFPLGLTQQLGTPAPEEPTLVDGSWFQDYLSSMEYLEQPFTAHSPGYIAPLTPRDNDITQDTLYGLFAPPQKFP